MRFLLIAGSHVGPSPDGKNPNHMYSRGDKVEHHEDLAQRWPEKFQKVNESDVVKAAETGFNTIKTDTEKYPSTKGQVPPKTRDELVARLNAMSVKELQTYAADEEIDTKGSSKKDELLKSIIATI